MSKRNLLASRILSSGMLLSAICLAQISIPIDETRKQAGTAAASALAPLDEVRRVNVADALVPLKTASNPVAPTNVTASAADARATIYFAAPASSGSPITGFLASAVPHAGGSAVTARCPPSATSCTITGLLNGTPYDLSVQIISSSTVGPSTSASNNPVTPAGTTTTPTPTADAFTFSGPAGGAANTPSALFTVTPNGAYTGTVTVTPSGGGLSTAIVLTFNNSSAAQTFTITPLAAGPITLQPRSTGSLRNPGTLSYATPPAAPAIGAAVTSNGAVSITFTPPVTNGGSPVTGYIASCAPGNLTATADSSPITFSTLPAGTYSCSVQAMNAYGTGAASSATQPFTAASAATSFTFTGPAGGDLNIASELFTVNPNGAYKGTITIALSGGGLSTPIVLTFNNSSAAQIFTITPVAPGPISLVASNSSSLANPPNLSYGTAPAPPTIGTATAANGSASLTFTRPDNDGGAPVTSYAANCVPGNVVALGASSPLQIAGLTNGTQYSCSVTASNAFGKSIASSSSNSFVPGPNTFTITGPTGGPINEASGPFSVKPSVPFTGTITINRSGGGLSTPVTLKFNNSNAAQSFALTPSDVGPITITASNSGTLMNPASLTYATPPAAPVIGEVTAGNASASVSFSPPARDGGAPVAEYKATCSPGNATGSGKSSPITIKTLSNGSAYTCSVVAINAFGSSSRSDVSNPVTPGPHITIVNAASFKEKPAAPGYIGAIFGPSLANDGKANALPLPFSLGGTTINLVDTAGKQTPVGLYFTSAGQINFVMPDSAQPGAATLQILQNGTATSVPIEIDRVQPGLFSVSQTGVGPAIGNAIHVNPDNTQSFSLLTTCTSEAVPTCTAAPIEFGSDEERIFLTFYGTGFRGRSSLDNVVITVNGVRLPALYAGSQTEYPGMDQLNVELPRSIRGIGDATLRVYIDGTDGNDVRINVP